MRTRVLFSWDKKTNFSLLIRKCPPLDVVVVEWTHIFALGYDYTSGVWQFEGNFYVPQGSSGVIIMQIDGAATEATTLQLRVYNGDLKYYGNNVVASNIYDKWLRLNVIHSVGAGKVTIFIEV
ncbi:unnamed protein product [Prunus armeniaca]